MKKLHIIAVFSLSLLLSVRAEELNNIELTNKNHFREQTKITLENKYYSAQSILRASTVLVESFVKDENYLVEESVTNVQAGVDHAQFAAACAISNNAMHTSEFSALTLLSSLDLKNYDIEGLLNMTHAVITDELAGLTSLQNTNPDFDPAAITNQIKKLGMLEAYLIEHKDEIIQEATGLKNGVSTAQKALYATAGATIAALGVGTYKLAEYGCAKVQWLVDHSGTSKLLSGLSGTGAMAALAALANKAL